MKKNFIFKEKSGTATKVKLLKKSLVTEAATRCALCKKVFLEISQNSQENTCATVSFLINLQPGGPQLY